jgi:hypothetical protein
VKHPQKLFINFFLEIFFRLWYALTLLNMVNFSGKLKGSLDRVVCQQEDEEVL